MSSRDLGVLLEHASAHVHEVDLAERAWSSAVAARRRHQRVAFVGVVVLCGVAIALGTGGTPGGDTGGTIDQPSPSILRLPEGYSHVIGDIAYRMAPPLGTEVSLPAVRGPLPESAPANQPERRLSQARGIFGPTARLRAVMLARVRNGTYQPVLFGPGGLHVRADTVNLWGVAEPGEDIRPPLSPGAVAPDGLRVAFPQPGAVVVLHVDSGDTTVIPVPENGLTSAEWGFDGEHLVARSSSQSWAIDADSGAATRLAPAYVATQHYRLAPEADGVHVVTWSADGRVTQDDRFAAPVGEVGDTVASVQGWAAAWVHLLTGLPSAGPWPANHALLAVNVDLPSLHRMLVLGDRPPRFESCCQVLGWSGYELFFLSGGQDGDLSWLLAWNVSTGQVARVSMIRWGTHLVPGVLAIHP
jgi:hypothetical protein